MHTVAIGVHICVAVIYRCAYVLSECMCAYTRRDQLTYLVSSLMYSIWTSMNMFSLCLLFVSFVANLLIPHFYPPHPFFLFLAVHLVRLSFFPPKSVSRQQVQVAAPQPSPGSPLVPAIAQPAPPGTSQQVRQLRKQPRRPVNTSKLI